MHTNSDALPTYPEFLKNRFKDTKTFLKIIQKRIPQGFNIFRYYQYLSRHR
jgi:hypothetical protein